MANFNSCPKTGDPAGLLPMAVWPTLSNPEGSAHTASISINSGGSHIAAGYPNCRWQRDSHFAVHGRKLRYFGVMGLRLPWPSSLQDLPTT